MLTEIKLLLTRLLFSLKLPIFIINGIVTTYSKVLDMRNKLKMYEDEYGIINLSKKKTNPRVFATQIDKLANKMKKKLKREDKKIMYRTFKDDDGWITTKTHTPSLYDECEEYEYNGKGYFINKFTGKIEVLYDYKEMHKITDNLASGAIGCEVDVGWVVVPVYDLDDNERDVKKVMDKVELVSNLLRDGFKVCVCCHAGINRSNTVAIGALMNLDTSGEQIRKLWQKYYNVVQEKVSWAYSFPEIRGACKQAVSRLKYGDLKQPVQSISHHTYLREFVPIRRSWNINKKYVGD